MEIIRNSDGWSVWSWTEGVRICPDKDEAYRQVAREAAIDPEATFDELWEAKLYPLAAWLVEHIDRFPG